MYVAIFYTHELREHINRNTHIIIYIDILYVLYIYIKEAKALSNGHWQRTEAMLKTCTPYILDIQQSVPTLVHFPPFQGMHYPGNTPSTHPFPWQPILSHKKLLSVKILLK